MNDPRHRYMAHRCGEVWWGLWDTLDGRWVDERRWLHSLYPAIEASRLNHPRRAIDPAGMLDSDGLGG